MKGGHTMIYRRLFDMPAFGGRNLLNELESMRRRFDRMMHDWPAAPRGLAGAGVFPLVNVTEDVDKFYLRAELPGVKNDALDIQASGKTIAISGERRIAEQGANARYHRREREAGKFSRILQIPGEIDADRIEAKLQNGILTVIIPKAEAAKPRQVKVN
jgi:HSP20 family protein